MRIINIGTTKFNVALGRGLRAFKPWNWVRVLVAVPLLLTAALWVMAPQLGQAQGTAPAQPTGLAATAGYQEAALTWDDPEDSSITGYEYLFHAQVAKLVASDGADNDYFGFSVAVDGDTAVVGAPHFWAIDPGAAYVYTRQSGAWNQVAKLTASDGADNDQFGGSVAIDGDTVVVGADGDDSDQGAAHVFTKPAGGWATTSTAAKLTASDGATDDQFGISVAMDGDTVVVSADEDDSDQGAAYVFTKPAGGWATTSTAAKLTASDGAADDQFGFSVAMDGDTVVVGAYGDDSDQGAAHVFTKPAGGWATTSTAAKLTASDGATDDQFGISVAMDGDTVVVSADEDDSDQGAAYVFTKPAGGWATTSTAANLTASDGAADDWFGFSVAMDGDTVVVGATIWGFGSAYVYQVSDWTDIPDSGSGETNATSYTVTGLTNDVEYNFWIRATNSLGASPASDIVAVIIEAPPAKPTGLAATPGDAQATLTWDDPSHSSITGYEHLQRQVSKLTASDGEAGDWFGRSVAVDGDTAVVSAFAHNGARGAAYVLTQQSGAWSEVAKLTASDGATYDWFGHSVAVDGNTVVVGALYNDDGNGESTGSAYVFTKPANGWTNATETAKLTANDGAGGDAFGYSVAVDGNTVVVGAAFDGDYQGSAYVFTKPANGWTNATETAQLTANDGSDYDIFGGSVAVDGDTVVIGAWQDEYYGANSGLGPAYVFIKPATGWTSTSTAAKLTANDGAAADHFGVSVALDGDTVVVGATGDDDRGSNSGSAYVFVKPATGWTSTSTATKLTAFDGEFKDYFGESVSVDGDTVMVGAWGDDDNGSKSGSVYVYHELSVSDWTAIPSSAAGETNATSYTVTGLTNDVSYSFRIRATNPKGTSPASAAVTARWWPAPTNLVAGEDSTRVVLQWDTGDPGITHYLISCEITDGSGNPPPDKLVSAGSKTRRTAEVTSLTNGTEYTFTVQAAAVSGGQTVASGPGASVNATPAVNVPGHADEPHGDTGRRPGQRNLGSSGQHLHPQVPVQHRRRYDFQTHEPQRSEHHVVHLQEPDQRHRVPAGNSGVQPLRRKRPGHRDRHAVRVGASSGAISTG